MKPTRAACTEAKCGIAEHDPLVAKGDDWWAPMTDKVAEDWIDGKVGAGVEGNGS